MCVQPQSPAWQRGGQLLALMLALSVLFIPATGWSWVQVSLGFILVGLPLLLAEQALAVRAQHASIAGMQRLTRESDAARAWRLLAYNNIVLSAAVSALLAVCSGLFATQALQTLWLPVATTLGLSASAAPAGAALWPVLTLLSLLLALGRSFRTVPMTLWLLVLLVLLALLGMQVWYQQDLPLVTDLSPLQGLAPVAGGQVSLLAGALMGAAGLGATAALRMHYGEFKPGLALPAMLLILFVVFCVLHHGSWATVATLLGVVVTQLGLSASLAPLLAEARARQLPALAAPIAVIIPVTLLAESIWLWGDVSTVTWLLQGLAYVLLINMLVLSLYAGWVMKISHLRKAAKLPSEMLYNVLRIALRWVVPLTLLVAVAQAQGWL